MAIKSISSTTAKNNFGQVLEDINQNHVQYVIERHGIPKAVLISLEEFSNLLSNDKDRRQFQSILREIRPQYHIGQPLNVSPNQE